MVKIRSLSSLSLPNLPRALLFDDGTNRMDLHPREIGRELRTFPGQRFHPERSVELTQHDPQAGSSGIFLGFPYMEVPQIDGSWKIP